MDLLLQGMLHKGSGPSPWAGSRSAWCIAMLATCTACHGTVSQRAIPSTAPVTAEAQGPAAPFAAAPLTADEDAAGAADDPGGSS
jgi:hypothetical protein